MWKTLFITIGWKALEILLSEFLDFVADRINDVDFNVDHALKDEKFNDDVVKQIKKEVLIKEFRKAQRSKKDEK